MEIYTPCSLYCEWEWEQSHWASASDNLMSGLRAAPRNLTQQRPAACCLQHPVASRYGIGLDWLALEHLVLSNREAVDAALSVSNYVKAHTQLDWSLFSLVDGGELERKLKEAETAPPPVIQPLPQDLGQARRWLFFLYMPPSFHLLSQATFLAEQALLLYPRSSVREETNMEAYMSHVVDHYGAYQQGIYHTPTSTRTGTAGRVEVWTRTEVPKDVGPRHVDSMHRKEDGVWYPDSAVEMCWKGSGSQHDRIEDLHSPFNPFAKIEPEKKIESLTERLQDTAKTLQWCLPTYGTVVNTDPERGYRAFRRLCAALCQRSFPLDHPAVRTTVMQVLYHIGTLYATDNGQVGLKWRAHWDEPDDVLSNLRIELDRLADELAETPRERDSVLLLGTIAAYLSGTNSFMPSGHGQLYQPGSSELRPFNAYSVLCPTKWTLPSLQPPGSFYRLRLVSGKALEEVVAAWHSQLATALLDKPPYELTWICGKEKVLSWVMHNTVQATILGVPEWAYQGLHFIHSKGRPDHLIQDEVLELDKLYADGRVDMARPVLDDKGIDQGPAEMVPALLDRASKYGQGQEVLSGHSISEECEREFQREEEKEKEVEREAARVDPTPETDWAYETALYAQSISTLRISAPLIPLQQMVCETLQPKELAAPNIAWSSQEYCTENFAYAVQLESGTYNEYLRPVESFLQLPDGCVVLLSEREADALLELACEIKLPGSTAWLAHQENLAAVKHRSSPQMLLLCYAQEHHVSGDGPRSPRLSLSLNHQSASLPPVSADVLVSLGLLNGDSSYGKDQRTVIIMLLHGLSMVSQGSLFIPQSVARSAFNFSPYLSGGVSVFRDILLITAKNLPLLGGLCRGKEEEFEETSFTLSKGKAVRQFKKTKSGKGVVVKSKRLRQVHRSLRSKASPFVLEPLADLSGRKILIQSAAPSPSGSRSGTRAASREPSPNSHGSPALTAKNAPKKLQTTDSTPVRKAE
eukprot:gene25433-11093_t